jgi:putative addiction module killer protein
VVTCQAASNQVVLDLLALGMEGQWRAVGKGIRELKIPEGKGYRVYYGWDGPSVVLLLYGGYKSTQRADTAQAKAPWSDYHERR